MAEPTPSSPLAEQVAATARALAAAGLVEAFGHVSARLDDGGLLITPTTPLPVVTGAQVVRIAQDRTVVAPDDAQPPLEVALHAAIYRARPDVGAICRGHGPAMVAWGTGTADLPLRHGLGLLAGTVVRVHPSCDLVTTPADGDAAATTLGDAKAMLLIGNGGLAVGADLLEAATRIWFLEERARVALATPAGSTNAVDPGGGAPNLGDWARRSRHSTAELRRASAWFAATHLTPRRPIP